MTAPATDVETTPVEDSFFLVAIGDSIPYNAPEDCPGCTGFVDSFGAALEEQLDRPVVVVNRSRHDGASTHDIVLELDQEDGPTGEALESADVVIVSVGYNDGLPFANPAAGCPAFPGDDASDEAWVIALSETTTECIDDTVAETRQTATQLFARVRELAPDAAIGTLTIFNLWAGWSYLDTLDPAVVEPAEAMSVYAAAALSAALCEAAASADIVCIDVATAFNGPDGLTPSGALLAADHAHPSQAGNDLIRDVLLASELMG